MREQTNIGGYRLIKRIGAGGMSTVFEAEDGEGRRVAFKLFHPGILAEESGRDRLRREVAMLQKVRSPFVAEVLDAETDDAEAFIVTELIDGPTLEQDVADSGVYDGDDLVDLARRLGEAVDSIHRAGVLHRDLKPSNVMVGPQGPVLIDFGIAQLGEDARLTAPGSLAHTPGYCDPVVIHGEDPSPEADWWSLAAVVAFAATGRAPFGTGSPPAIMRRVLDGEPDLRGLPTPLARALASALDVEPSRRIAYDELVETLRTGIFDDASAPGRHSASGSGSGEPGGAPAALGAAGAIGATGVLGGGQAYGGQTEVLGDGQTYGGQTEGDDQAYGGRTEVLGDDQAYGGQTEVLDSGYRDGSDFGATEIVDSASYADDQSPGQDARWGSGPALQPGGTQVLPGGGALPPGNPTRILPANRPWSGEAGLPTEVLTPEPPNAPSIPPGSQPPSQEPQPYPAWGEQFGGPTPANAETPPWMRPAPTARLHVALAGLVLCALAVRLPLVALAVYGFLATLLAVGGASKSELDARRQAKGGKYPRERLGVVFRLPRVAIQAVIAQIVCVGVSAAIGVGAIWAVTLLRPGQPLVATLVGAVATICLAWAMEPNRNARQGARNLVAAIAPEPSYKVFWAFVLCGIAGFVALYSLAVTKPDWTPLPGTPIFART